MAITLQSTNSLVNARDSASAASQGLYNFQQSIGSLQNTLRGIDTKRDEAAKEAFQNRIADLSMDQLQNFQFNEQDQVNRLGQGTLRGMVKDELRDDRAVETEELNYANTLDQRAAAQREKEFSPLREQLMAQINVLQADPNARPEDFTALTNKFIEEQGENIDPSFRNEVTGLGLDAFDNKYNNDLSRKIDSKTIRSLDRQNRAWDEEEESKRQKKALDQELKSIVENAPMGISDTSLDSINTRLAEEIGTNYEGGVGGLTASMGPDGELQYSGKMLKKSAVDNITRRFNLSPEEREEVFEGIDLNDPVSIERAVRKISAKDSSPKKIEDLRTMLTSDVWTEDGSSREFQSAWKKIVRDEGIKSERDLTRIQEKLSQNETFNNLSIDEQEKYRNALDRQAKVNYDIRPGAETQQYEAITSQALANRDLYIKERDDRINLLQENASLTGKLSTPENMEATIEGVTKFFQMNSRNMDDTMSWNEVGGKAGEKHVIGMIMNGFKSEDGKSVITPDMMSRGMVETALAASLYPEWLLKDAGIHKPTFRNILERFALNKDAFKKTHQTILEEELKIRDKEESQEAALRSNIAKSAAAQIKQDREANRNFNEALLPQYN